MATVGRSWCFTVNNYTADDEDALRSLHDQGAVYLVFGREVAPETGTPHIQGYVRFKSTKRFRAVKALLPDGAHIELAVASAAQNKEYCSKEGDVEEFGDCPGDRDSQRRANVDAINSRYDEARQLAKDGNFDDIPSDLYVRHLTAFHRIRQIAQEEAVLPNNDRLDNHWYCGPSGSGKSFGAREDYPDFYAKSKNKWWGGYKFQANVIIDDIDPSHQVWIGAFLKEWSDHYCFNAETKGSGLVIRPARIIVTSQYRIDQIFHDPETVAALERRFTTKVFVARAE